MLKFASRLWLERILDAVNQTCGGAVMGCNRCGVIEFIKNSVGEGLAQLDTPLVKAVDIPKYALHKGFMFV